MKTFKHLLILSSALAMLGCSDNQSCTTPANDGKNAAIENIMTRTSVRQYQADKAISPDTVEIILRAAMAAPTAVNKQPWKFVVLDQRQAIDSLSQYLPYAKMLAESPVAIVTCADLTEAIPGETFEKGFWIQDVSAATENLLLAAHALGLGAVWTGVYPSAERVDGVQKALNLPDSIIPLAVVPIGYPNAEQTPKDKWQPEKIHYNKW